MLLSPRRRSTLADLLRVVAGWLVVVLLMQGVAVAHATGLGPLHRHQAPPAGALLEHRHHHDAAERHHHPVADADVAAVPAFDDAAAEAVAGALAAAGVQIHAAQPPWAGLPGRAPWLAAPLWSPVTGPDALPIEPPRAG